MRRHFLSAIASCLALTPVFAHASAYEAASTTWTGMFVGINAAYGTGHSEWDLSGSGSGSTRNDLDGGMVGIQLGYNAQLANNLVAGVEASIEGTSVGGDSRCSGTRCKSDINSLSDLSGRLGVNMGNSLLFGKAGVAYQNISSDIGGITDKGGSLGFIGGAGAEFMIDHNLTTKLEYDYYHFGSDKARVGTTNIDDSSSLSVFKLGFNIKFN